MLDRYRASRDEIVGIVLDPREALTAQERRLEAQLAAAQATIAAS